MLPNSSPFEIESKELAHYGLIKSLMDRLKLTQRLGQVLPQKSRHHKLSHSEIVTSLIYNMLGQGSGRLYSAKNFFEKFPVEEIFNRKIDVNSFNASTLSRTLDAIAKYGPDEFFLDTAFKVAMDNKLLAKELHLDSTTVSFSGRFKKARKGKGKREKINGLKITHGHSKAKRPDMIQVVMSMITGGRSGIPYWINTHSGNTNDNQLFQNIIIKMTSFLETYAPLKTNYFVADSALYSKHYLLNHSHYTRWITRVPESVKTARQILEEGHKGEGWIKLPNGYKYRKFESDYSGVPQRWLVVHSNKAYFKEKKTFRSRIYQKEVELRALKERYCAARTLFRKKEDAYEIANKIRKFSKYHEIDVNVVPYYRDFHRYSSVEMVLQGYYLYITYHRKKEKIQRAINRKGKFIVATNIKDWEKTDKKIIDAYMRRNANIETCFRQIKSSQFLGKGIYFKNVERIQAYMSVVALALFVNNVGKLILRKGLKSTKQTIKNFGNRKIKNPTFMMLSKLMRRVQIIKIRLKGKEFRKILDLDPDLVKVINIFGPVAQKIYGFP